MLTALKKTLLGNTKVLVAAGAAFAIAGAGGTTLTLASSGSHPDANASADSPEPAESPDASEAPDGGGAQAGARPTDTHGFCVSKVAQVAPQAPTGTGSSKVTHGTLVSAAAHACGKTGPAAKTHGKSGQTHGHKHA